jgi:hypothetical protein
MQRERVVTGFRSHRDGKDYGHERQYDRRVAVEPIAAPAVLGMSQGICGAPLSTALTGAAEASGLGDPDGSGTAVLQVNPGEKEVCYLITVAGINVPATTAHIH